MKAGDKVKIKGPSIDGFRHSGLRRDGRSKRSGVVRETWRDAFHGPVAGVDLDSPYGRLYPRETFKIEDLEAL